MLLVRQVARPEGALLCAVELLPDVPHRLPRSGNLFRTDLRFASSLPQRFACGLLPFTRDMGVHGLCGRVPDSAGSIICHLAAAPWPGDSLIRSRCARLLAKPEYFPAE